MPGTLSWLAAIAFSLLMLFQEAARQEKLTVKLVREYAQSQVPSLQSSAAS